MENTLELWEKPIDRTWDSLEESPNGLIDKDKNKIKSKMDVTTDRPFVRNLVRFLVIVIDLSDHLFEKDSRFQKWHVLKNAIKSFLKRFLNRNNLSFVSIVISGQNSAERLSSFEDSVDNHLSKLEEINSKCDIKGGQFSFQNSLILSRNILRNCPEYSEKETFLLLSNRFSSDTSNIFETISTLRPIHIRVSIIHLSCAVFIHKLACDLTKGRHEVVKDEKHLNETVLAFSGPLPALNEPKRKWIPVSFPKKENGEFTCGNCSLKIDRSCRHCSSCGILNSDLSALILSSAELFPPLKLGRIDTKEKCEVCQRSDKKMKYFKHQNGSCGLVLCHVCGANVEKIGCVLEVK